MNILKIPEDFPITEKNESYFSMLKEFCYAANHFGIDIIIEDLEKIQKKLNVYLDKQNENNEDSNKNTITISSKEYEDLVFDSKTLLCLEKAGVDNWEGYDSAMEELYEKDLKED